MSGSVAGLLIHAGPGILGALGRRVKRRGFAAQAAFSTAWRLSLIAGAVPICTEYGVCSPIQDKRQRSEEHTSELQSHLNLVCRLLLEKKKTKQQHRTDILHI